MCVIPLIVPHLPFVGTGVGGRTQTRRRADAQTRARSPSPPLRMDDMTDTATCPESPFVDPIILKRFKLVLID